MYKLNIEEEIVCDILNGIECVEKFKSEKFDFDKFFKIINEQKIFPYVYIYLKKTLNGENLKIIENEAQRLKIKNLITLHQMNIITRAFKKENISFAFSKGLVSAFYTCDNPLLRDMNDIDLVINSQDFLRGCNLLERLGYRESFYDGLQKSESLLCSKDEYYSINSSQCTFEKANNLSVELKDEIQYINKDNLNRWFDTTETILLYNVSVPVFNKKSVFKNMMVNSFKNLCSPYGIENDYKIKDILEPYFYIIKNKEVFTDNFIEELNCEFGLMFVSVIKLIEEFLAGENFDKLPSCFHKLKLPQYGKDFMSWEDISILERMFDKDKRIKEHELFRYNNYINVTKKEINLYEVSSWTKIGQSNNQRIFEKVYYRLEKKSHNIKVFFRIEKNFLNKNVFVCFRIANPICETKTYEELEVLIKNEKTEYVFNPRIGVHLEKKKDFMELAFIVSNEFEFFNKRAIYLNFFVSIECGIKHQVQICSEGDNFCFSKFNIT